MRNPRAIRLTVLLLGAGPLLNPAVAADWPRDTHPPRSVRYRSTVLSVPAAPPPVLVRDYLPRNLNVPMYNEPPRRAPAW